MNLHISSSLWGVTCEVGLPYTSFLLHLIQPYSVHESKIQLTILSYELCWLNSFKTETVEANITFSNILLKEYTLYELNLP